ncbi:hypothetical protein G8C93_02465 [Cellulosimicrobium cellulans]|uniref:hypothetical protein n=1 Tax=Cellulosimicrobium cellulans TaxID=1710 RepID=UPI00188437F8|nr:hypothetical protein [Cellulosimicrobium cellulans]MBE9924754.1 hypothetical protein [Cellulosimicrobium cellulans]
MTDQEARLARHVAEAADAWLRDPLDAGVYRRLVDATLAWRSGGGRVVQGSPAHPAAPVDAHPDLPAPTTADDEDDDARYLRPERAPRAVGSTLADVASMLRARASAAAPEGKTPTDGPQEHDDRA